MAARFNLVTILGLMALIMGGANLAIALAAVNDTWWTPKQRPEAWPAASGLVKVIAKGQPLGRLLDRGELVLKQGSKATRLAKHDFSFRFNQREKARADRFIKAGLFGAEAAVGLCVALFGFFIFPRLKKARAQPAGNGPRSSPNT